MSSQAPVKSVPPTFVQEPLPERQAVNSLSETTGLDAQSGAMQSRDIQDAETHAQKSDSAVTRSTAESDRAEVAAEKSTTGFFEVVRKYASVSDMLRLFGAAAVAVAMGLFLLDGVKVVNDLQRFLTMLGLTGALTAAGLLMSSLLKEQRGSRVFITLALLSVPVNFTVIGALLYSVIPLDTMALNYPGYAHWQVGGLSDLAIGLAAAVVVLGPVVWAGFSVLARSASAWLSMALIASSAILLIPVRAELWSAGIAVCSTVVLWLICKRYSAGSLALKTTEGKLAIALLFVAPVIVAARSLFLYDVNGALLLVISVGFYVNCRQILTGLKKPGALSSVLTLLTSAAIGGVVLSAMELLANFLPEQWMLFSVSIGLLLLSHDLLRVSPNPVLSGTIGLIFSATATFVLVAMTVFWAGMILWVALAMIAIVVVGSTLKINLVTLTGAIGLLALISLNAVELLLHANTVWTSLLMTGWWGVAAGGALAILAGSLIDRAGTIVAVRERPPAQSDTGRRKDTGRGAVVE